MKLLTAMLREQQKEAACLPKPLLAKALAQAGWRRQEKLDAVTCLFVTARRQVAANLKELCYGG